MRQGNRKQYILAACALFLFTCLFSGCGKEPEKAAEEATEEGKVMVYEEISQEEAKDIMDTRDDIVILDVREQDEYDAGHIPGAVLLPYTRVDELAESMLPDKDRTILVYCRTGRRSKIAAQSLAELGYSDVLEFGGILNWPYETVSENR